MSQKGGGAKVSFGPPHEKFEKNNNKNGYNV